MFKIKSSKDEGMHKKELAKKKAQNGKVWLQKVDQMYLFKGGKDQKNVVIDRRKGKTKCQSWKIHAIIRGIKQRGSRGL